jgi:hypothetical protein
VLALLVAPVAVRAEVFRVEIAGKAVVAGGQAWGAVGPYEKLSGTIAFALDPRDPRNARIVDLDRAPRASDGRVHFTADLYVLRPVDPGRGNGVLFFEASNRGRKGLLTRFNAAPASDDPSEVQHFGDGYLLREGYTLVWVGWEFDLAPGLLRADVPPATVPADARLSASFIVDEPATESALAREVPTYAPANPDDPASRLTVRDTFWSPRSVVPRDRWRFKPGAPVTTLVLDGGFEPGKTYEVTYRPATPRVSGVGFAAIRDAASAFRYRTDLPVTGRSAMIFGSSQTGRFLREFLYEGFNADERGRRVFDGVWPHIAGASRGSFNARFATPIDLGSFDTTVFPFSDHEQEDRHGRRDGLLARYATDQRPKVFHTNTSVEYWGQGRAAALVHTTPDGARDAALPDDTRVYHLAGTQHGEAPFPPARTNGQALNNPTPQRAVMRALLRAMHRWMAEGTPPPASRHPRVADGTLVPVSALKFPAIPGLRDPRSAEAPAEIRGGKPEPLPFLVPQVDADGNERGGIRVPELAVPLATTTGWNFRAESKGNPGSLYYLLGSYVPFAPTRAERDAQRDPRPAIEERYASREEYLRKIAAAAADLVRDGFLLLEDVPATRARAAAHWDYATRARTPTAGQP